MIIGHIGSKRVPVVSARLTRSAGFEQNRGWTLSASLEPEDFGFRRIELSFDAGDLIPPSTRAIERDRFKKFVAFAAERLREPGRKWRTISFDSARGMVKGVEAGFDTERGWVSLCVLLYWAERVPRWYNGTRRLAIADWIERLDFSEAEIEPEPGVPPL